MNCSGIESQKNLVMFPRVRNMLNSSWLLKYVNNYLQVTYIYIKLINIMYIHIYYIICIIYFIYIFKQKHIKQGYVLILF